MELIKIDQILQANTYPGRGIVLGRSACGNFGVLAYFIMGRSANSRNRIFVKTAGGIATKAFDETKVEDPSLIIYPPVVAAGGSVIVTNGDQTLTIASAIENGGNFYTALQTRTFEPDAPNYTPRISGILNFGGAFSYKLSILKSANGASSTLRQFFEYEAPVAGKGHFIHTYSHEADPLPSFAGEPKEVEINGGIEEFAEDIWQALNEENKISLFVQFQNIETGETKSVIKNKNR